VFEKFKAYKALVENQTSMKIKTLRSDNGGEFLCKKFDDFLHECGMERQTSAPYTPQQNGVVERTNRTIMECVKSIRAQGLDLEFWAEAVNTAVYIKNRCRKKTLDSRTPQEAWTGTKPDVSHLRVFGCKTFAHILDEKSSMKVTKYHAPPRDMVFIGPHTSLCTSSKSLEALLASPFFCFFFLITLPFQTIFHQVSEFFTIKAKLLICLMGFVKQCGIIFTSLSFLLETSGNNRMTMN